MNKDVNPLDLANVMGTSLAMISEIYQHYQVEQHYDELVASEIDYREVDPIPDTVIQHL